MSLRSRALFASIAACSLSLCMPSACGGPSRPAALGDDDGGGDDGGQSFSDGSLAPPNCGLGPEAGQCACVDVPLLGDPPTLYFVLDRSGSMNDSGKWMTVQLVLAELVIELGARATFAAAVFPDPTMDACAPGIEVFAPHQGDTSYGQPGPISTALLTVLGHITANGGTPTAATFQALLPRLEALRGRTYVIFATDGGPNCNGSVSCTADQCQPNIENVPGCPTDGSPDCCLDPHYGGNLSCEDTQPTAQAIADVATAGIPVYVVGVPASEPYANVLDQLAMAGGTARGSEPQYYAISATDQSAFYSTISKIAAKITGSCTFDLGTVPPDPSLVNVFLNEQVLPQAGPDGWTLQGSKVTILGSQCQAILAGDVLDVRIAAGCPTVLK